ncbi:helix-turn-helix domain-containing protein [Streptomyces sp. NPDC005962]|uniref:helix-turn-helix domain-containing protein n=1 Tax=Streptomyces sp. NPDC005962 TaxID=3154466 RepID=UPI0033D14ACC
MRGRGGDQRSQAQSAERRAEREALVAKLKDRYEAGASISELAEEAGFSEVHTYRRLVEAGTKMRRPGPRSSKRSKIVNDSDGS